MKALIGITAKVDGVQYSVPAGQEIPAALVAYWTTCNLLSRLKAQGAIEPDVIESASAKTYKTKENK